VGSLLPFLPLMYEEICFKRISGSWILPQVTKSCIRFETSVKPNYKFIFWSSENAKWQCTMKLRFLNSFSSHKSRCTSNHNKEKETTQRLENHPTISGKHPIVLGSFKITCYPKNNIKMKDGNGWLANAAGEYGKYA
jgi:hypothetical protein